MKTSVIEVRDMLSVLSVLGVEKRIGEVPGVESVTVNFAAKSATVRYDETRLEVADIKSDVRHRGYASVDEPSPKHASNNEPANEPVEQSQLRGAPADATLPAAAAPKDSPTGAATEPAAVASTPSAPLADPPAAEDPGATNLGPIEKVRSWVRDSLAGDEEDKGEDKAEPDAPPSTPAADAPRVPAPSPAPAPGPQAADHSGHAAPGAAARDVGRHGPRDGPWRHRHGSHGARHAQPFLDLPDLYGADLRLCPDGRNVVCTGAALRARPRPVAVLLRERRRPVSELALLRLRLARAQEGHARHGRADRAERGHRVPLQRRLHVLLQGRRAVLRSGLRPAGVHPARPLAGNARPRRGVVGHQGADEPDAGEGQRHPQWRRGRSADRRGAGGRDRRDPAGQQDPGRRHGGER